MSITKFAPEELDVKEIWGLPCPSEEFGSYYGIPYFEMPKYNTPVTPKENFELFRSGKDYYWNISIWSAQDFNWIFPYVNPDCQAWSYDGGIDSFGVEWIPIEGRILPAIHKPGNPLLTDICDWRDVVKFPDVDSWDWEGSARAYSQMDDERARVGVIPTAFFERLIDLMEFEGAALAMIEEPEETAELMQALADFNISILEHYKKYYDIDILQVHDDWGTQRAPIFSREALSEVIIPAYKRLTERAHELGVFVNTHCCGCCEDYIDEMIEAGGDMWQLQGNANPHIESKIVEYRDRFRFDYGVNLPEGASEDEIRQFIADVYREFGGKNCSITFFDSEGNDLDDEQTALIIYEMSRKCCSHEL